MGNLPNDGIPKQREVSASVSPPSRASPPGRADRPVQHRGDRTEPRPGGLSRQGLTDHARGVRAPQGSCLGSNPCVDERFKGRERRGRTNTTSASSQKLSTRAQPHGRSQGKVAGPRPKTDRLRAGGYLPTTAGGAKCQQRPCDRRRSGEGRCVSRKSSRPRRQRKRATPKGCPQNHHQRQRIRTTSGT